MSREKDNSKESGCADVNEHEEKLVKGCWGRIKRRSHRQASVEYIAKIFDTKNMTTRDLQNLGRDVRICSLLQHQNIVRIRASIAEKTDHNLVFESVGGELLKDIATRTQYSEADASLYIRQIIGSIYYCHQSNIIHKEIKPEKLLLASENQKAIVKFANFGMAIKVPDDRTTLVSFSGTLQYLSPEVLRRDVCGKPVDMWGCGVILYILLVGYPPFRDDDQSELEQRIKAANYDFPSPEWDNVTGQAKDLVKKMLTLKPESRINVLDALQHPWINQRNTIASKIHRQDTVDHLKKFIEKPKRTSVKINAVEFGATVYSDGQNLLGDKDDNGVIVFDESSWAADDYQTKENKEKIIRLAKQILKAKVDCDFEAYCKLVSTDVSCFGPETRGNLVKGVDFQKSFFENISTKRGKPCNATIINPHVTLLGDDGACIAYVILTQNLTSNDQGIVVKQVEETLVWHRANGEWRVVHFHHSD